MSPGKGESSPSPPQFKGGRHLPYLGVLEIPWVLLAPFVQGKIMATGSIKEHWNK
mgnify:CR=1 FL=1